MTHHFTITPLNTCRRQVAVLSVVLMIGWFVATPRQAFAASKTWSLSGTGDWNSGDNWSDGLVPSSSSSAFVDNGGTVNLPAGASGTASTLYVGYNGTGSLSLTGGSLKTANGCYLGYNPGSSGTATITSGTWNAGDLTVGNSGAGTLNINGGYVDNHYNQCVIGGLSGNGPGTVTVTSGTWNAGSLFVSAGGAGTLNIDGGLVSSTYSSIGKGGPSGTVTVTSGTWNAGSLYVGNQGAGTLTLNGGLVSSDATYIGYIYGGNGAATVTSGTWNAGNLTVGDSKKGTLTIGGSGVVNVGNGTGTLTLSASTGSVGTLNMGDGTSIGTLNATSISIGSGNATINFNHAGDYTFNQQFLTGNLGNLSMNKLGAGTTTLTGNAQISSATVSAGELSVSGSLGANTTVSVSAGAVLSGSGTIHSGVFVNGTLKGSLHTWTLSGSGLVSPGNSPGILTSTSINPTGGISFAFEFTLANTNPIYSNALASGNDILHLTGVSPFSGNLTADNLISIYLQRAAVGDTYQGGFFTNLNDAQLQDAIQNAQFAFFVEDDVNGTISFNGKNYSSISAALIGMGTTQANGANFADGTVNGSVLKVTVVPEPCTWWMLTAGMVILIYLKSPWVVSEKSEINPWLE